jgi:hypothetical protein
MQWTGPRNEKETCDDALKRPQVIKSIAFAACAVLLTPCTAFAAAHVELANSVAVVETHSGALVAVPVRGAAVPGERLRYSIVAKNTGDRAAAKLAPLTKIPAGERYIGNTAGTTAEFSVDGGKTWSREPLVTVTNPGGALTQRRALPAPGARMIFTYDVTVE